MVPRRLFALRLVLLLAATTAAAQDIPGDPVQRERRAQETEAELGRIREAMAGLKRQLEEGRRRESAALAALADAERAVSLHRQRLADLDGQRATHESELQRIATERTAVEADMQRQRAALAAVLRLLYARNRQAPPASLLLRPEHLPNLARTLGYGRALQRAHLHRLRDFAASLARLGELAAAQEAGLAALADIRERADEIEAELLAAVAGRERALDALRLELAAQRRQAGELERDERRLLQLLERLRDIFADLPQELGSPPFRSLRGRLPWPAEGAVRAADQGGVVIAAPAGAPVRAVAHGRVAFADWLKGYGLLLIIDHGDGYMTLYGHNEALLKAEGAWVQPGDTVGRVGRSGGEAQAGLYFGLRERGRSIDPRPWLHRR